MTALVVSAAPAYSLTALTILIARIVPGVKSGVPVEGRAVGGSRAGGDGGSDGGDGGEHSTTGFLDPPS